MASTTPYQRGPFITVVIKIPPLTQEQEADVRTQFNIGNELLHGATVTAYSLEDELTVLDLIESAYPEVSESARRALTKHQGNFVAALSELQDNPEPFELTL